MNLKERYNNDLPQLKKGDRVLVTPPEGAEEFPYYEFFVRWEDERTVVVTNGLREHVEVDIDFISVPLPPTWADIPKFTRTANYHVDIPWDQLEYTLERWSADQKSVGGKFEMDPDFQRGHVWDEVKQTRYVEYVLRGGKSSTEIYWNHPNWMGSWKGSLVLVDGKQRLEAVRKFLRNDLVVFGEHRFGDFQGHMGSSLRFSFNVNDLKTRTELLQWYLDMNDGGVVHTNEELNKVRQMLNEEKKKS